MNDNNRNQGQRESLEEKITRLEIRKIRLETDLIESGMRRDRIRLVIDAVKWSVIAAAVVLAYIAANHLGWL